MKRITALICTLLVIGFTLSAAVNVSADDLQLGAITSDTAIGDVSLVLGNGSAEVVASSAPAVDADGNAYEKMLTLSGDSLLSFSANEGETLKITALAPSDGTELSLLLSSDTGVAETLTGTSADGVTVSIEYPIEATGTYTVSAGGGTATIYQVVVE